MSAADRTSHTMNLTAGVAFGSVVTSRVFEMRSLAEISVGDVRQREQPANCRPSGTRPIELPNGGSQP